MDQTTAQMIVGTVGVAGTLSAAVITQVLARRAERERRAAEDTSRWLSERLRVSSELLGVALAVERDSWSACAHLDQDDRAERMPGYRTILLTPEEGLPGVFDEITRAIIVETTEEAFKRLEELEHTVSEIALIGTPEEAATARDLYDSLWEVVGELELYAPFDVAADAVQRCRSARDAFSRAVRASLRVDGELVPPDRRPRQADNPRPPG